MSERDDVQIEVGGEIAAVPSLSFDWLRDELIQLREEATPDVFENVDWSSKPVRLATEQKTKLLAVIDHWVGELRLTDGATDEREAGDAALEQYEGVSELRAALRRELGVESSASADTDHDDVIRS
jgi:hypothetical protein